LILFNFFCNKERLLIGYTGPTTLALQATGKGGVDEVVSHLKDDQVQYTLIRLEVGVNYFVF
jgi:hypothetical protein